MPILTPMILLLSAVLLTAGPARACDYATDIPTITSIISVDDQSIRLERPSDIPTIIGTSSVGDQSIRLDLLIGK